jgi:hypothetical protein
MDQESREIQLPAPSDLPAYKALANEKRRLVKSGGCLEDIKKRMTRFLDDERTYRKAALLAVDNDRGGHGRVQVNAPDDESLRMPSDDDDLEEFDSLPSTDRSVGGGHLDGCNYDSNGDGDNDGGDSDGNYDGDGDGDNDGGGGDGNSDGDGSPCFEENTDFEESDYGGHELASGLYKFLQSSWAKVRKAAQINVLVSPLQKHYSFVSSKLATFPRPLTVLQLGSATTFNEFLTSMADASPGKRLAAVNTHLALLEFLISGCSDEDNTSRSLLTTYTTSVLKMKSHVSSGRTRLSTSSFCQQSSPEDSITEQQVVDSARVMVDWYLEIQPRVTAISNKARDSGALTPKVANQHGEAY